MANLSGADLVLRNFVWKIEGQSPTSNLGRQRFEEIDPTRVSADQSAGIAERSFTVFWSGSVEDHSIGGDGVSDSLSERPAEHRYTVEVYYSTKYKYDKLQHAILQDRHDLTKLLRGPDSYSGYNASNSSTDIGLWLRVREEDELDTDNESFWIYRATWRVTINEGEN